MKRPRTGNNDGNSDDEEDEDEEEDEEDDDAALFQQPSNAAQNAQNADSHQPHSHVKAEENGNIAQQQSA